MYFAGKKAVLIIVSGVDIFEAQFTQKSLSNMQNITIFQPDTKFQIARISITFMHLADAFLQNYLENRSISNSSKSQHYS